MKNGDIILSKKVKISQDERFMRDIIAVDLDQTIVTNPSVLYKLLNIGVGKHRFISAVRDAVQRHRAEIFDFRKKYKKSAFNSLFGMLNPDKFSEIKDAVKYVNKLSKDYDIFLVTSRPVNFEFHRYLLSKNIKNLGLKVDFVIANCADKAEFCQKLGAKFLVDNCINYCVAAQKNTNTKAICFNKNHIGEHKKVLHLGNWESVFDFIKYIDPLSKTQDMPYTNYGLSKEYSNYLQQKICGVEKVVLSFNRKYQKENTK